MLFSRTGDQGQLHDYKYRLHILEMIPFTEFMTTSVAVSSKFYRFMLSIIKSSFNLSVRNFLFQINSKYIDYLVVFTVAFFGSYHRLYLFLHNVNSWCYQWAV